MRKLVDVPNTNAPDSDYPKGSVRDKSGPTAGTTGGEILFGDITQFFQKLVIDGSITENDLPDNVSNGYQLVEALMNKIKTHESFTTATLAAGWSNAPSEPALRYRKNNMNQLEIDGAVRYVSGGTITTLPSGYRPSRKIYIPSAYNSSHDFAFLLLDTTGVLTIFNSASWGGLTVNDDLRFQATIPLD